MIGNKKCAWYHSQIFFCLYGLAEQASSVCAMHYSAVALSQIEIAHLRIFFPPLLSARRRCSRQQLVKVPPNQQEGMKSNNR